MTFAAYAGPNAQGVFPTPKDEVRFLSGNTVSDAYSVSDEEIAYLLLAEGGSAHLAAADVLDKRAAGYEQSGSASQSVAIGPFGVKRASGTEVAQSMRDFATQLRSGALGGTSPVVSASLDDDGDWGPLPQFGLGMNDYPGGLHPVRPGAYPATPRLGG